MPVYLTSLLGTTNNALCLAVWRHNGNTAEHSPKTVTSPQDEPPPMLDPPDNPAGGRTLVVDSADPSAYPRPSSALKEAGPDDQVFVRPGRYEDKVFLTERPVLLIGSGRDRVEIFSRRGGPLYLQRVTGGRISGITFRYVGSDQHSAINILDSSCTIIQCRAAEGILSGVVIYGAQCRPSLIENEVCYNRESGIFAFAGAQPYLADNACYGNHHFGIAARDPGTRADLVRNLCRDNMLSGMLLFYHAEAMLLNNTCRDNYHWGLVMTPDSRTTPSAEHLDESNVFGHNPRGLLTVTEEPLKEIGR
jgi:hypothetical protein